MKKATILFSFRVFVNKEHIMPSFETTKTNFILVPKFNIKIQIILLFVKIK